MAKVNQNLESVNDIIYTLDHLEDPDYLLEQGIDPQDLWTIEEIREDLHKQLEERKWEIEWYIRYKLKERLEDTILLSGLTDTIKTLTARKKTAENKIIKTDTWLDYLCQKIGMTELKIPEAELKYKEGSSMIVNEPRLLPDNLKKYMLNVTIEEQHIEDISSMWYVPQLTHIGLPEVKKRYKTLSEEEKKNLGDMIYIDNSKFLSIKQ